MIPTVAAIDAPAVDVDAVTLRLGETVALDDLTMRFDGGRIHALLGRNGAGKSSLLSVLAGLRRPTSGDVRVGGLPVFENSAATRRVCLVRDAGDTVDAGEPVRRALEFQAVMRPGWHQETAERLLDRFEIPAKAKISSLSRGKRSALGATLGIASRSPVTIFDETYVGMDAPTRYAFYEAILDDAITVPRTVVLATHYLDEVASILDRIAILDHGRLLAHEDAETLRARAASVTGPTDRVAAFVAAHPEVRVIGGSRLGGTSSRVLYGPLDDAARREADGVGLEIGSLTLQDLFVHLTTPADAQTEGVPAR